MNRLFYMFIFLFATYTLQAQKIISGYVFDDSNVNGKKERREKGISGVAVSNGKDVVLTDKKGGYKLPIGKDNPIFVIKPSGYNTAVDENNLPQFYYLYKPQGSPQGLKFEGVAPTGSLPGSVDFALVPVKEEEKFTALIFGDPQPYNEQEVGYFDRTIVSEVEGIKGIAFGLSLGDLVGNDLDLFKPYIKSVKKIGIPWHNIMGNHDMNFDVETDSLSDETYEAHFGPANYAFNYGKVHFIILDDILYPDPRDGKGYWAGFREDQLHFIENDLKFVPKDHLVVVAFHIPLSNSFREDDRQRLFNLLKDFPHTLSLSAHTHMQRQDFFTKEDGWRQEKPHHHYNVGTTSGSWYAGRLNEDGIPVSIMRDGTPQGYSFITFNRYDYTIDYKVVGHPSEYQMEIFSPKVVPHNKKTSAGIYVNFFIGRKEDKVMYRVDDGPWKDMHYQNEPDPNYLHLLHEWDFAEELMPGKRLPNAANSTHLWRTDIPTNLDPGKHIIEVKATDMFGKTFTQKSSYRIEKPKGVNP